MNDVIGVLLVAYTMLNIFSIYMMLEYAFYRYSKEGFRVKHLIFGLLVLPASILFVLILGITSIVSYIIDSDFWNKRLF